MRREEENDSVDRVIARLSKETEVARVRRERSAVADRVVITLNVEGGIGTLDLAPISFDQRHRDSYPAAWAHVLAEVIRLKVRAGGGLGIRTRRRRS